LSRGKRLRDDHEDAGRRPRAVRPAVGGLQRREGAEEQA
jgi:hypothetical protein